MKTPQMIKHWCSASLIAASCMAAPAFAAQSGKDMTIWFDAGGPVGESYVTVVQNGAKQAAEDLGVDLRLQYSEWQPEKMIENFKRAVAAKPTGIVVVGLPGDTAYKPLVDDALAKGIQVTSFDTELPATLEADQSKGFGYVGDNNAVRGLRLAKEALRRSGLKAGEHALVWGLKDRAARSESTFGLIKGLEQAGIKVDFLQISPEVDKDPSLGAPVFTSYMASHPDVKMVLVDHGALTAQMGNLMRNASVKPGEIYVAGFSLSPATAEGIQSGYVQLVADAQPYLMGYLSVVQIVLSKRYGFSGLDISTGAGFVSKENIGLIAPLASKGLR